MELRDALNAAIDKVEQNDAESTSGAEPTQAADTSTDVSADAGGRQDTATETAASGEDNKTSTESAESEESTSQSSGRESGTSVQNDEKSAAEQKRSAGDGKPGLSDKTSATDNPADENSDVSGKFRVDRPPQAWKGETRKLWNDLPLTVRQEVYRRERAVDSAMRESADARNFALGFQKVIEPYAARLNASGGAIKGIQMLLQADHALSSAPQESKAKMMAALIEQYGVNVEELDKALQNNPRAVAGGNPIVDSIKSELDRRLAPVTDFIANQRQVQQQTVQSEEQQLQQTLIDMANDTENYEFFQDVIEDMADLIDSHARRGVALTPQQAYSKAVRIHPEIGPMLQAREAESQKRDEARRLNEQALKAKAASVSVSGAPLGKPTGTQNSGNSVNLRETIESAWNSAVTGSGRI